MSSRPLDPLALPLSGTQLIEASAGTGKTYTITTIVLRLVLETQLTIDRIVVVTFTRAATSELRDRIRQRIAGAAAAFQAAVEGRPWPDTDPVVSHLLGAQEPRRALRRLQGALRDLDRAAVFTIHGFAQRMLQEHAFESGARFDLELVGEQRLLVSEVAHDFWATEIATLSDPCFQAIQACNVTLRSVVSLAHVAAAFPDLPLSPDLSAVTSQALEQSVSELRVVWARLGEAYHQGGDEAFALLSRPGLHKTHYAPAKLAEYREELQELIEAGPWLFKELPRSCKWLAAGNIRVNQGHVVPEHPLFDAIYELNAALERARGSAVAFVDGLRCRLVGFARERVALEHARAGTQSFDELLYSMRRALQSKSTGAALARHIRDRFPVALIDEFQDTDPVQYEIFRRVYGSSSQSRQTALFLIGDPKQAIYGFRGADIHAYLEAARDAARHDDDPETGGRSWTLTTNYRSDPSLIAAINCVFGRLEEPFLYPEIRYIPVSAAPGREDRLLEGGAPAAGLELLYLSRADAGRPARGKWGGTEEWQQLAAEEVARLLGSGRSLKGPEGVVPVEPRHIAVITRTNRQAQDIQEHLSQLGIPSVLQGDRTVFEAPEAGELALILRALAEPSSEGRVRTALATRFFGLDAAAIAALSEDEAKWEAWTLRFRTWHGVWAERGFMQSLEQVLRDQGIVERTLQDLDGERRLTNLRHLLELLHQVEREEHLGIPGLLQWFDEARIDPGRFGMAPEAHQLRLESDADAVVLTTMHKSKGLEYPIVVLPFLGAASAPFPAEQENLRVYNGARGGRLELDVRAPAAKPEAIERAIWEHQAEAMRLAYVALTRARHRCVVLWGGVTGAFSSLGYLLHQPGAALGEPGVDLSARLEELDDQRRYAELEALAAASQGLISVRRARLGSAPRYARRGADAGGLEARKLTRPLPGGIRTSSFSAMARTAEQQSLSVLARVGRDVDEHAVPAEGDHGPAEPALVATPASEAVGGARLVTLADFPRGPKPGELLHTVLEKVSFAGGEPSSRQPILEAELKRHGFDVGLLPVLERAVEEVLSTPLGPTADFTLSDLLPHQRVCEMEFTLPVALSGQSSLSAARLAHALGSEVDPPWTPEYPQRVARLGFGEWSGFLRGFIDLIFEREGAYYVVDYKSNHLGPSSEHYQLERLGPVMEQHHYHLQYVLYSVALHRYLAQRISGYSFERHFGGVHYLFLRGMHPETGSSRGVFSHRPSGQLIEALSALLGAEASASCA